MQTSLRISALVQVLFVAMLSVAKAMGVSDPAMLKKSKDCLIKKASRRG